MTTPNSASTASSNSPQDAEHRVKGLIAKLPFLRKSVRAQATEEAERVASTVVADPLAYSNSKLCTKCATALPQRFKQPEIISSPYRGNECFDEDNWAYKNQLKWEIGYLTEHKSHCSFCQYLSDIINVFPEPAEQALGDEDHIVLRPHCIGSVHFRSGYGWQWRWRVEVKRRMIGPALGSKDEIYFQAIDKPFGNILPLSVNQQIGNKLEKPEIFHGRMVRQEINFDLMRNWYQTCCKLHGTKKDAPEREAGSRFAYDSYWQPRCDKIDKPLREDITLRLIDVHHRCIIRAQLRQKYAALSYVWGSGPRFLLSQKNVNELEVAGSLAERAQDMPQTFLDAMDIVGKLGIDYLWVDSLCIVQDDTEDIRSHLENMDVVYNNAELTIVSTAAAASSGIPGYPSYLRRETQLEYISEDVELITTKQTFAETLKSCPWESRAWTLQEKVFSKRMLIFTESQAFWHCYNATWFEDTTLEPWDERVESIRIGDDDRYPKKDNTRSFKLSYNIHTQPTRLHYQDLVRAYIPRQLSFPADALNAFRGILKLSVEILGADIWGLPHKCFVEVIAWSYGQHIPSSRRSAFPSWSWAGWAGTPKAHMRFREAPYYDTDLEPIYYQTSNGANWTRIECRSRKMWGENERITGFFGINDHPGGTNFKEQPMMPFEHKLEVMPPISHILRFWTSSAILEIKPSSEDTNTYSFVGKEAVPVFDPNDGKTISNIDLDPGWLEAHAGPAEFIVISSAVERWGEREPEPDDIGLSIMLIRWKNDIAYRVQICSTLVSRDAWREARPKWKLITLA